MREGFVKSWESGEFGGMKFGEEGGQGIGNKNSKADYDYDNDNDNDKSGRPGGGKIGVARVGKKMGKHFRL